MGIYMEQFSAVDLIKIPVLYFLSSKKKTRIKLYLTGGVEARPSIGSNRSDRQREGVSFSIFFCVVRRPPKMRARFIDLHTDGSLVNKCILLRNFLGKQRSRLYLTTENNKFVISPISHGSGRMYPHFEGL
jgi:hypothetical protein